MNRRPPIHLLYLVALVAILARAYLSGNFQQFLWPLAVLVIAPVALGTGSLMVWLWAPRDLQLSWAVSVWTLLFCLVGFDVYLNFAGPSQETKVERILRERHADPHTLPAVVPQGFLTSTIPPGTFSLADGGGGVFLPLADVSSTRSVYCREAGDYTIYRSDERGFNNPQGVWAHPIKIAMVGDSYIHGACVRPGADISSVIRRRFPGTVNLGRGGNGPLSELAILTEYAAAAKPPLVIWFHVDNDLRDLGTEKKSAILMSYLSEGTERGLAHRTVEIDKIVARYLNEELARQYAGLRKNDAPVANALKAVVHALSFATIRERVLYMVLPPSDEDLTGLDWDLDRRVLQTAKNRVEKWGGRMIVMIIPFQNEHGFFDPERDPRARVYRDRVIENVKSAGLTYYDLNENFHHLPNPNHYLADMRVYYGHDNEAGYALLAQAVTEFISQTCKTRSSFDCAVSH